MSGDEDGRDDKAAGHEPAQEKDAAPCHDERPPVRVTPVKRKIGEGEGNLQRRENFLRRRRR